MNKLDLIMDIQNTLVSKHAEYKSTMKHDGIAPKDNFYSLYPILGRGEPANVYDLLTLAKSMNDEQVKELFDNVAPDMWEFIGDEVMEHLNND